jgi:hypothetical protein
LLRHDAPYGGSFELAFAPDSNINRSTRSDTVTAFGLPFTLDEGSRGRSGVGLAFAGQLFGRLPMGDHRLTVALSGQGNLYKHRAANQTFTTLSAGPQFRFGNTQVSASAIASRGWQGGNHASDSYGIDAKARFPLGTTTAVALGAAAIHERNQRSASSTNMSYTASAAVEKACRLGYMRVRRRTSLASRLALRPCRRGASVAALQSPGSSARLQPMRAARSGTCAGTLPSSSSAAPDVTRSIRHRSA